jgi:hypothetical protein
MPCAPQGVKGADDDDDAITAAHNSTTFQCCIAVMSPCLATATIIP